MWYEKILFFYFIFVVVVFVVVLLRFQMLKSRMLSKQACDWIFNGENNVFSLLGKFSKNNWKICKNRKINN